MLSDQYHRLPVDSIIIPRDQRQRREIVTEDLEQSIARLGVLQPIIVTRDLVLVAGERRLEASKRLGLPDIPARFADELSQTESKIIELEENVKRLDLTWQERVRATAEIHQLFLSLDENWTQEATARQVALADHTTVSRYLKIAPLLGDPRIAEAKTYHEALNVISRREQRRHGEALEALLNTEEEPGVEAGTWAEPNSSPTNSNGETQGPRTLSSIPAIAPTPPPVICGNFLEWALEYSGPRFNLIHCDFPYGIRMFSGPQSRGSHAFATGGGAGVQNPEDLQFYPDDPEIFFALTEGFCQNLDRVMTQSGHLMFWMSAKHQDWIRDTFRRLAPSLIFQPFPLIWHKTDNTGIASDSRRGPRHVYETCLLATRGDRHIVRVVGDCYGCPTDKRLHPSCKPEPMLRHFMSMLVDEHTRVLDPTAGSGSALRAAESLGAAAVLGIEVDEKMAELANIGIRNARALRRTEGASASAGALL